MKTRKSIFSAILISLLVLAMLPTSAFADAVTSITVNSSSTPTTSTYYSVDMNSVLSQGGTQIYETEFTVNGNVGGYFRTKDNGTEFYPVWYNGSNLLFGSVGKKDGDTNDAGYATTGEKYHAICVINVGADSSTMDVYVNGVQVANDINSGLNSKTSTDDANKFWRRLDITNTGVDYATLSVAPTDFDITKYAASATVKSSVENIAITGNTMSKGGVSGAVYGNLGISLGKRTEKVTKSTLMNSLDISTGASAVLYAADGETALGDNDYVENGAVLVVTSENGKVENDYKVAVEYSWPAAPYEYDNTQGTGGHVKSGLSFTKGDSIVIDYTYTVPAAGLSSDFVPAYLANSGAEQVWRPVYLTQGGTLVANYIKGADNSQNESIAIGEWNAGETYHVVGVLRFDDNDSIATKTQSRIFVNGVEVLSAGPVRVHYDLTQYNKNNYDRFAINAGAKGSIRMCDMESVADFDYAEYFTDDTALAAPKAETNGIYVTGDSYKGNVFKNFGITVAKTEKITAGDFLNSLDIAGTAALYASSSATEAMANDAEVATDSVLKITSANGEVVNNYVVTVLPPSAVDVITLEDGTASVKASNSTNKLFIAAYKTENGVTTLEEVKMGSIIGDTLTASLTETERLTIRAFYWTDALVPIDTK